MKGDTEFCQDGDAENNDESTDLSNIEGLIEHCSNLIEAKYLMQHLFNACLEHAVAAAKADSQNKESEARIQQLEQQSFINEQLLSTVIADKNLKSSEPLPYRARRHTATADEMLYPTESVEAITPKEPEVTKPESTVEEEKKEKKPRVDAASLLLLPSSSNAGPPAATSNGFRRHSKFRNTIANLPPRPLRGAQLLPRPTTLNCQGNLGSRMLSSSRLPSLAEVPVGGEDPPTSSVRERAGADHATRSTRSVFARLIPWTTEASPSTLLNRRQGRIVPVRPGTGGQYRVVTRTATVEGHSKAVLSVAATDELLLSGSKDRTAKLWDLQTGSEVRTLGVHPNNVHAVRFIPNSQLAISVSMYQVCLDTFISR
ncbi:hypothetical protein GCK32_008447 [Trichostrongylus colubriformis]|uniref:KIF21A/B second helical domain-containing protein n=1 Tax=Trichostrongylus colubriformis TaxID=6319 RepID=A0AAN8G5J0_TRICO